MKGDRKCVWGTHRKPRIELLEKVARSSLDDSPKGLRQRHCDGYYDNLNTCPFLDKLGSLSIVEQQAQRPKRTEGEYLPYVPPEQEVGSEIIEALSASKGVLTVGEAEMFGIYKTTEEDLMRIEAHDRNAEDDDSEIFECGMEKLREKFPKA